ncbi:MAG TPA: hypothetical protein VKX17_07135 [Planctomycetota bacterium]|nr:hypothetical protein [Planctomycetota bacterium]
MDHATYARPCVIIRIKQDGTLTIIPISSKDYGNVDKFRVDERDPDFAATGLTTTSYVYGHPVLNISPASVLKKLGAFVGELKRRFIAWNG